MHLETCIKKVFFNFFGSKRFFEIANSSTFPAFGEPELEDVGPFQPASSPAPFSGGVSTAKTILFSLC